MAYMDQEHKKELAPGIKAVLQKYAVKGTIAVRHHSTLIVNIRSGRVNFERERVVKNDQRGQPFNHQVNTHWIQDHWNGEALNFLTELKDAMNVGNFDKSDIQTDYFFVGWYTEINVGDWGKPYDLDEVA